MDFCSKCGFLLPAELVGKTNSCRSCSRQETDHNRNVNAPCQCEYCHSPFAVSYNAPTLNGNVKSHVSNSRRNKQISPPLQQYHKNEKAMEEEQAPEGSLAASQDWSAAVPESPVNWWSENTCDSDGLLDEDACEKARQSNSKMSGNPQLQWTNKKRKGRKASQHQPVDCAKVEWVLPTRYRPSEDWDSEDQGLNEQFSMDWADATASTGCGEGQRAQQKDWGDFSMGDDDGDFYVDTHDNNSNSVTDHCKTSSESEIFGNHDFPPLEKDLKEHVVEESVRADWERQQNEYKRKLIIQDTPGIAKLVSGQRRKNKKGRYFVGGVDISFIKDNAIDACACLSIVRMPDLELVYQSMEMIKLTELYIPGFLAFREVPPLMTLFKKLKKVAPQYTPDVVMVDGNGILHPRGFGLASQLGVMLDIPSIGVAKTLITAQGILDDDAHKMKKQKLLEAGHGFDLISQESGQVLGKCVRVHDNAPNPIYVSVGHKISLKSAVWLVLECSKYRIPEPIRRADLDSREYIRQRKTSPEVFIM